MSSTRNPDPDARIDAFFRERLVPAAEALRARGASFFALRPEDRADSFYEPCVHASESELQELEADQIAAALVERWTRQGLPELAGLVEPMMTLAREVGPREDESGEVSPFIYVMF